MIVYPAIDLRGGRVVRLLEGDFSRETRYDDDPAARARSFEDDGAEWLHVVDLDAARGEGDNRDQVRRILSEVSVPVQVGGGVRDLSLLSSGVARVVIGSLLVKDRPATQALLRAAPGKVALGLDHRDGVLRVGAWEQDAEVTLEDTFAWPELKEAAALVVTDIATDGTLAGPGLENLRRAVELAPCPVIASGGVGTLDDVSAVRETGASGLIIGKALYEGRFPLREAIRRAAE